MILVDAPPKIAGRYTKLVFNFTCKIQTFSLQL